MDGGVPCGRAGPRRQLAALDPLPLVDDGAGVEDAAGAGVDEDSLEDEPVDDVSDALADLRLSVR